MDRSVRFAKFGDRISTIMENSDRRFKLESLINRLTTEMDANEDRGLGGGSPILAHAREQVLQGFCGLVDDTEPDVSNRLDLAESHLLTAIAAIKRLRNGER